MVRVSTMCAWLQSYAYQSYMYCICLLPFWRFVSCQKQRYCFPDRSGISSRFCASECFSLEIEYESFVLILATHPAKNIAWQNPVSVHMLMRIYTHPLLLLLSPVLLQNHFHLFFRNLLPILVFKKYSIKTNGSMECVFVCTIFDIINVVDWWIILYNQLFKLRLKTLWQSEHQFCMFWGACCSRFYVLCWLKCDKASHV